MKTLGVWVLETQTGILSERADGRMTFSYLPLWLNHPDAYPLSRSLPLRDDPHPEKYVQSFFSGLLPEERIRRQVAANLGVSESNNFALLEAIGGECAGAVFLLPEQVDPPKEQAPMLLTEQQLAVHLQNLPRHPLLAGTDGIRLSLAGAQSKLPVRKTAEGWSFSSFHFPSTHILKPMPPEYQGLVQVEGYCLNLARHIGIKSVEANVLNLGGNPVLCLKRYDRETDRNGFVKRIHQEDLCQSLGLPPSRKYQQEGGPSALQSINCIREWSSAPVLDIRYFLDLLIFNILIGNADAHGKNFSWLYQDNSRRLAPAYDLVSTALWPELSSRMAMRIGQAKYIEEATLDHFQDLGRKAKLGLPLLKQRIRETTEKVVETIENPPTTFIQLPEHLQADLQSGILRRATKMLCV